ncbi:peptidoglycan-binding domain-containing protein [Spirillospora sp. CA-253888]
MRKPLRPRLAALLAAGAVLAAPMAGAVPSASAKVAVPAVPKGLPGAIEQPARYVPQHGCDPVVRAGAQKLGRLLAKTYPGTSSGEVRPCGDGGSEHYEGRAVDWMVGTGATGRARVDAVLKWLLASDASGNRYAMARRLGVMYLIWDKKIYGLYRPQDGWRPYACSGVTACHQDHLHLSLSWEGAMGRTSYWTKRVAATDYGPCRPRDLNWAGRYTGPRATPCPSYPRVAAPAGASAQTARLFRYSGAYLLPGATGPIVSTVQRAFKVRVSGSYDATTRRAVAAFQKGKRLKQTGRMNRSTWRALLATVTPAKR